MLLAEFIRRTGFTPEFADTLSSNWQEAAAMEALPECFTDGFFERYAEKLAVPTPFGPGTAGIERAGRGGTGAARLRESDHRRGIPAR